MRLKKFKFFLVFAAQKNISGTNGANNEQMQVVVLLLFLKTQPLP